MSDFIYHSFFIGGQTSDKQPPAPSIKREVKTEIGNRDEGMTIVKFYAHMREHHHAIVERGGAQRRFD